MSVSPAGQTGRNRFVKSGSAIPFVGGLVIASWNVEGLSDLKLWELTSIMLRRHISILCIQESHILRSPYYTTDNGFLVVLSGSSTGDREFAGVGFIIAPWMVDSIVGFLQFSNRLACLKLRVTGGVVGIISAYAPHSGYPFDIRQQFFEQLGSMYEKTSVNKGKVVLGDLNCRIHRQLPGEEAYFGEHIYGNPDAALALASNRELLSEFCCTYGMAVANTFFSKMPEEQVTFRSPGTPPLQEISVQKFAQLDYLLLPQDSLDQVRDLYSCRSEALASQHFLLEGCLAFDGNECSKEGTFQIKASKARIDRTLLKNREVAMSFKHGFNRSFGSGGVQDLRIVT